MWIGVEIALFVVGLAALIWGADKLVDGASHLAHPLGVHPILIGMTILSIGTSIPDIIVCA
jgi:cation:H+ antiporter